MHEVVRELKVSFEREREQHAISLPLLAKADELKVYAELGYSSLFAFVTQELGLSEASAMKRIQAARVAKRFPQVLDLLRANELTLSAISLLSPHLREDNAAELLQQAKRLSTRKVERLLATIAPRPEPPQSIRKLPERPVPRPLPVEQPCFVVAPVSKSPKREKPVSATRTSYRFCAGEAFERNLKEVTALLRHKFPEGRLEDILGEVLESYLERKKPKAVRPKTRTSNPRSRHIPAPVKQAVWKRDEGCCSFIADTGRRCRSREFLQFDHVQPWALGGSSTDVNNVRLLCSTHNQWLARRTFGGGKFPAVASLK